MSKKISIIFSEINAQHTEAHVKTVFFYALFYPAVELVSAFAIALVIWRGGIYKIEGLTTFGALVAFIQYAQMFFRPISDLSEKYNIMQQAMASSERIFKLLDTQPDVAEPDSAKSNGSLQGEIVFKDVSFAYEKDNYVLKNISFDTAARDQYCTRRAYRCRKNKYNQYLARHYDIQNGDIFIDGISLKQWDLADLRHQMAVVLQDVFLFSGTVYDNIRLGDRDITEEKINWAIRQVNAHHFIERLPQGLHTQVKERGATLSVGQKQLIAFARALVSDPKILILDEATSSVDTETEILIQDALKILMQRSHITYHCPPIIYDKTCG